LYRGPTMTSLPYPAASHVSEMEELPRSASGPAM
jgi:hypothetical protein